MNSTATLSTETLSIGAVAAATGTTVSALRYYDEVGLIDTVARLGGKRRFAPETVGRVNFVQRSKEAGFTLAEIALILDDTAGEWRQLVDTKLGDLRAKRDRLDQMIDMLGEVRECGCQIVATCTFDPSCCQP